MVPRLFQNKTSNDIILHERAAIPVADQRRLAWFDRTHNQGHSAKKIFKYLNINKSDVFDENKIIGKVNLDMPQELTAECDCD